MIWLTNASLKPLLKISEAWCSLNSISKCCIVVKASALLFPCCLADPSGLLGWENMAVFSTSTAQGPWQEGLQGHRIVYTEMDLKRIAHSTWQSIGLGPMMMTREDKLCWPDSNAMTLCATVWQRQHAAAWWIKKCSKQYMLEQGHKINFQAILSSYCGNRCE